MKITGIIAEYNPFHNGHKFHLQQTRDLLGSDYIIVVMSGNYVQRGAPTIIDKYSRAEMALRCGADLVLELPCCFSTASAEYFAFGGVAILDKLKVVDSLCFGSESLDDKSVASMDIVSYFNEIAELMLHETPEFQIIVQADQKAGMSHAAALFDGIEKVLGPDYRKVAETSNNILGVEYVKALKRLGSNITPEPIARMLSHHNDMAVAEGFSSATAIRNAVFNQYDINSLSSMVPEEVFGILMDKYLETFPIFRDDFSVIIGSKLISVKEPRDLAKYFGINEDLANRIYNNKNNYRTFNQFRDLIECKSINKATAGRAIMHIGLGLKDADMAELYKMGSLNAVKVLGFRESAEPLLKDIKKKGAIKLVTKLAGYKPSKEPDMIEQTTQADLLYRMICMNKYDVELPMPCEEPVRIIK